MSDLIAPSPHERTWEPALSASRAKEYERCPLQYRLHVLDGYKEPETKAKALGTLVHSVLEDLFDLPPQQRTPAQARAMLPSHYEALLDTQKDVAALFTTEEERSQWMNEAANALDGYFTLEDPQWIQPWAREKKIRTTTRAGVALLGFVDRIDRAPDGRIRVVDYKTGKAPRPQYTADALFQMRFYAFMLSHTLTLPTRMQLVYMKAGQVLTFDPTPTDIEEFGNHIDQLWNSIEKNIEDANFQPRKNPLCNWCGVRSLCPLFGGTTPPIPTQHAEWLSRTRVG